MTWNGHENQTTGNLWWWVNGGNVMEWHEVTWHEIKMMKLIELSDMNEWMNVSNYMHCNGQMTIAWHKMEWN